jgi:hypothetical protein
MVPLALLTGCGIDGIAIPGPNDPSVEPGQPQPYVVRVEPVEPPGMQDDQNEPTPCFQVVTNGS